MGVVVANSADPLNGLLELPGRGDAASAELALGRPARICRRTSKLDVEGLGTSLCPNFWT